MLICWPTARSPLLVVWRRSTPMMTVGHLLFAMMTTAYILFGIRFEERDLTALYCEDYRMYQRQVRRLIPIPRRSE